MYGCIPRRQSDWIWGTRWRHLQFQNGQQNIKCSTSKRLSEIEIYVWHRYSLGPREKKKIFQFGQQWALPTLGGATHMSVHYLTWSYYDWCVSDMTVHCLTLTYYSWCMSDMTINDLTMTSMFDMTVNDPTITVRCLTWLFLTLLWLWYVWHDCKWCYYDCGMSYMTVCYHTMTSKCLTWLHIVWHELTMASVCLTWL